MTTLRPRRPRSGRPAAAAALAILVAGCGDPAADGGDAEAESSAEATSAEELLVRGQQVYRALCLTCHQADGGGVPMMQPPLDGSAIVLGEPARVVDVILRGVGGGGISLEASGQWPQPMGGYRQLPDTDVAAVTTYIRQGWSNDATPVSPELVAERRAAISGR